jgi:hypothetical protein
MRAAKLFSTNLTSKLTEVTNNVVPVGGADVLGALRIQLAEFGVPAVGAESRGDLGTAPRGQLRDGGAPVRDVTDQLRAIRFS